MRTAVALALSAWTFAAGAEDFRPMVADALARGEKRIVIPPGIYRLEPDQGTKSVWRIANVRDTEIIADGVTLLSAKLTRAVEIGDCERLTLRGLVVDYDPLPFTQGEVVTVAGDRGWIEVKLHAGYPRKPYARIDVVDPATRYRKRGMPFLWGTMAEIRGDGLVRVSREGIGAAAVPGDLVSLSTGPAPDGIPHGISLDRCAAVVLDHVTVHSAPGMGIIECDGEGGTRMLGCRVVPGPMPGGAKQERLLSTSWDAIQSKTIRRGPVVDGCEIRDAGDDSWSVQSADFMVLRAAGTKLVVACRDEYTVGVLTGDRLGTRLGGDFAMIVSRREVKRGEAGVSPDVLSKLDGAAAWSLWKVSPKWLELVIDRDLPVREGESVFSADRMGNGFRFSNNRIRSAGRVLVKAAGVIEDNLLDTPHALVVCPELPGGAAAGIEGLVIRRNTIRRAGWFCPAPWSSQAGALSITATAGPRTLGPAGVFANVRIEDNVFEDGVGPGLVISSARGVVVRGNRFVRPHHSKPNDTGAAYGISSSSVIWIENCEGVSQDGNPVIDPGPFAGDPVVNKP
ncbi:MAG: right-handed parallel beta-helix repeat-containing protein [Verrucomicrobia bacterium]|nr:right-handed parallel beta-helix repeat-containing protein [Verrucomicrobiota bacterium]